MKKLVLAVLAISTMSYFTACNSAPQSTETEHNHEEHHDGHDHNHGDHAESNANSLLAVPAEAKVFFANLADGDTVTSPFTVQFGIEGMEVEPAGEANEGKGHHHIIINGSAITEGEVVPADSLNIHFGGGQTETELTLEPGTYSLTMQFADGYHRSYGEQLSATIQVNVQ